MDTRCSRDRWADFMMVAFKRNAGLFPHFLIMASISPSECRNMVYTFWGWGKRCKGIGVFSITGMGLGDWMADYGGYFQGDAFLQCQRFAIFEYVWSWSARMG
jgi:hypothetical protein